MKFEVSVIIPVYNAELYLEKAVTSVLQLEQVGEVILIEDGSSDNSLMICKELSKKYHKIKLFNHSDGVNLGASESRNLGLLQASCDFISFLDADDFYLPNRFHVDEKIFASNDEIDGVYNAIGTYFYTNRGRKLFYKHMKGSKLTTVFHHVGADELFFSLSNMGKFSGYFSLDGLTLKRSALIKLDSLFNPHLRVHQDTEFIFRLSYYTKLLGGELTVPVALRGVHDTNRILTLRNDKRKVVEKREQLWISLVDWSSRERVSLKYQYHFIRMRKVYNLLNNNDKLLIPIVTKSLIKDHELFFKAAYFNPLFYYLFGNSVFSKVIVRIKQFIQKMFFVPFYESFFKDK